MPKAVTVEGALRLGANVQSKPPDASTDQVQEVPVVTHASKHPRADALEYARNARVANASKSNIADAIRYARTS